MYLDSFSNLANPSCWLGQFKFDKMVGEGKMIWTNGEQYVGTHLLNTFLALKIQIQITKVKFLVKF